MDFFISARFNGYLEYGLAVFRRFSNVVHHERVRAFSKLFLCFLRPFARLVREVLYSFTGIDRIDRVVDLAEKITCLLMCLNHVLRYACVTEFFVGEYMLFHVLFPENIRIAGFLFFVKVLDSTGEVMRPSSAEFLQFTLCRIRQSPNVICFRRFDARRRTNGVIECGIGDAPSFLLRRLVHADVRIGFRLR